MPMSYVPKYILKRMVPNDAIKLNGEKIEVKFINVLSPIQIKTLPPNYLDLIHLSVDGKPLDKEILKKVVFEADGKEISLENPFAANNFLITLGMVLTIKIPNIGLKKGETHTFGVKIAEYQKLTFDFERTIQ